MSKIKFRSKENSIQLTQTTLTIDKWLSKHLILSEKLLYSDQTNIIIPLDNSLQLKKIPSQGIEMAFEKNKSKKPCRGSRNLTNKKTHFLVSCTAQNLCVRRHVKDKIEKSAPNCAMKVNLPN